MNAVKGVWAGLIEKRLLPFAILLAAALIVLPMLLSKSQAAAPVVSGAKQAAPLTAPVVAVAQVGGITRKSVVGKGRDPFKPSVVEKAPVTEAATTSTTSSSAPASSDSTPAPATTPTEKKPAADPDANPYTSYSLKVQWGLSSDEVLKTLTLKQLSSVPPEGGAVLIFLGVRADNGKAVFLVDSAAKVSGEGSCSPSKKDCKTLELAVDKAAAISLTGADGVTTEYQLQVDKIVKHTSKGAKSSGKRGGVVSVQLPR